MTKFKKIAVALMFSGAMHAQAASVSRAPLVTGTTYTISVGIANTDPAAASPLLTTYGTLKATADANQQLQFQFPASTFTNCTQPMLLVIQDPNNIVVRRDVVPCPTSSSADEPIGVTPNTTTQAQVNLVAGTDPISTVFSNLFVRNNLADNELQIVGTAIKHGISNAGGFIDYLKTTRGVTQQQIDTYNSNINAKLTDPNSGYNVLMNAAANATANSVDDSSNRGKAAGLLLQILLDAADDPNRLPLPTDIPRDFIVEAVDAMGSIVAPELLASNAKYLGGDTTQLSDAAMSSVQSTSQSAIKKLKANRVIADFTDAMTVLGASAADKKQFADAVTALSAAMDTAYAKFEAAAFNSDPNSANAEGDANTINTAETSLSDDLGAAFSIFQQALSASNARMSTMIQNMCPLSGGGAGAAGCPTQADLQVPAYDANGNPVIDKNNNPVMLNWPINKVVLADWISGVLNAGGSLAYTRAADAIPASVIPWVGNCAKSGTVVTPIVLDLASCTAAGGTWTRTDFTTYSGIVASESAQMGVGEDISILGAIRDAALVAAYAITDQAAQMQAVSAAEKAYTDGIIRLAMNLSGTTNGTAAIGIAQQFAIITLMQDPNL